MARLRFWIVLASALRGIVGPIVRGELSEEEKRKREAFLKAREEMRTVESPTPSASPKKKAKPKAATPKKKRKPPNRNQRRRRKRKLRRKLRRKKLRNRRKHRSTKRRARAPKPKTTPKKKRKRGRGRGRNRDADAKTESHRYSGTRNSNPARERCPRAIAGTIRRCDRAKIRLPGNGSFA